METHRQLKEFEEIKSSQSTVKSLIILVGIIATVIVLIAFIFKEELFLPFSMFFVFFALSLKETSKHFQNLYKGMSSNNKTNGVVEIFLEHSSDSLNYHAQAIEENKEEIWKFEFMPLNWKPKNGNLKAKLVWIEDVKWPVLIETEDGIIYPKSKPKKHSK